MDSELTLIAISVTTLLVALGLGTLVVFRSEMIEKQFVAQSAEFPALSRIRSEIAELEAARDARHHELTDLDTQLSDMRRDKAEIEGQKLDAQHWQVLVDKAKRDYENLEDKVAEVDRVKDEYEIAANDLAARKQEIDDLVRKRDTLGEEIGDIEARREEAERLNHDIQEKQERLEQIREEISQEEDLREAMYQARFEVDQLARRKADLENDLERLPREVEALADEKESLQEEVDRLRRNRDEFTELEERLENLTARRSALEARIEELQKERDGLHQKLTGIAASGDEGELTEEQANRAVEDLWKEPTSLFDGGLAILRSERDIGSESEALEGVTSYLEELGLVFNDALIKQFHTSLKISRISPLTVLAGISGTGKSLLPQCYAEAMGMPFLKVAVQPRWDSPQDLLGFYNFLEKRYKATEFARALAFMDTNSQNRASISEPMDDRMLLVLLDEMNLARVEYYFSEFLSRLEGRPAPGETDEVLLRPCRIEIELPLGEREPLSIYPSQNTLFVGTMNEDESTQALSDKVLDRGNAIRFKRPERLVTKLEDREARPLDEFLEFETWTSWYRPELPDSKRVTLDDNLNTINDCLEDLGRPFGFRVYQAIYAYAANHPDVNNSGSEDEALSAMLTMRILPKLRGIELGTSGQRAVNEIASLVDNKLNDVPLAEAIRDSVGEDGMFTWKG
jgi:predicted  nucleic acid-binding Zn-ribbon protein